MNGPIERQLFILSYFISFFCEVIFCVESALVVFEKRCGTQAVEAYANK